MSLATFMAHVPTELTANPRNTGKGTFLAPQNNRLYYVKNLVIGTTGGTINSSGATGTSGIVFDQSGATITVNADSNWTGPGFFQIQNNFSGAELPISIAPNITLTTPFSLAAGGTPIQNYPFRVTGGGTLHLTSAPAYAADVRVNNSRLRMDYVTGGDPNFRVTLAGGTLTY